MAWCMAATDRTAQADLGLAVRTLSNSVFGLTELALAGQHDALEDQGLLAPGHPGEHGLQRLCGLVVVSDFDLAMDQVLVRGGIVRGDGLEFQERLAGLVPFLLLFQKTGLGPVASAHRWGPS